MTPRLRSELAKAQRNLREARSGLSGLLGKCAHHLGLASSALVFILSTGDATAQEPAPGEWGMRAPTLEPLSELALACHRADGRTHDAGA
jgi:hypothetical protein